MIFISISALSYAWLHSFSYPVFGEFGSVSEVYFLTSSFSDRYNSSKYNSSFCISSPPFDLLSNLEFRNLNPNEYFLKYNQTWLDVINSFSLLWIQEPESVRTLFNQIWLLRYDNFVSLCPDNSISVPFNIWHKEPSALVGGSFLL